MQRSKESLKQSSGQVLAEMEKQNHPDRNTSLHEGGSDAVIKRIDSLMAESVPDSGIDSVLASPTNSTTLVSGIDENVGDPGSKKPSNGRRVPNTTEQAVAAGPLKRPGQAVNKDFMLENTWIFWVADPNDMQKDWSTAPKPACDFSTVQDFWRVFNHLEAPSRQAHYIYSLFKHGIRPQWEDPANDKGGRWTISPGLFHKDANDAWLELCMLAVGGHELDGLSPCVNGIYLTWKKDGAHLSVWLNTIRREEAIRIGEIIKSTLENHIGRPFSLGFSECKSSSRKKNLYSL